MFSKKSHLDVKKSAVKIQDPKKDLTTRLKHLKIILDNVDILEAKGIFEANFSHVYHILYDSFLEAENHLRQRELSFHLVHKAHKEELENALWVLEQVLSLLPELLHKRWQLHSLNRILEKLLHVGNSVKVRRQAIKYFLMWYQALGENAPDYVHKTYASLVPNFMQNKENVVTLISGSVFHDTNAQNPVSCAEILPILPPSGTEKLPEQPCKFFLETLLENMFTTVVKLEWHDKLSRQHRCFSFLLERFKIYYLPKLFPNFCYDTSIYNPNLELPTLRKPEAENELVACRVSLIKWIANHMHQIKKPPDSGLPSLSSINNSGPQSTSHQLQTSQEEHQHDSAHPSLDSTISVHTPRTANDEELGSQIVRDVFYSSRENVNLIHEVYRQAFLLSFNHAVAIRRTITVYKDIIQLNLLELPPYALELPDDIPRILDDGAGDGCRPVRLRNDSYLGAIHKENLMIRAGLQNVLQVFVTHAANVFLLDVSPHFPTLLEEQTDACKRVLNIYRYMVMHTRMDSNTWEQLLLVLLQITSLVLNENPPKKKGQFLGAKLAPAIFQTLIVTWIKANLNVTISRELWDRFLHVLTSLTNWEELIKEWAKTLETLTRVLARHVYNLDLTDLPLDRLSEQKCKKTRRGIGRAENLTPSSSAGSDKVASRIGSQDASIPDSYCSRKSARHGLPRSFSETNLAIKRRNSSKIQKSHRKYHSLDNIHPLDTESGDRTRSPSPAPSSGLESSSMKDSPIQLDVLAPENSAPETTTGDQHKGVVCGGTIRGWLPDVAVILWKRMLGALGDVNQISNPKLHAQVFDYLIKLTDTLIKIKLNQGVTADNQSTPPPPDLVPPLTLIVPWCFEALTLPYEYEVGKLSALRLLCTITLNCDEKHRTYLPQFYQSIHIALCGSSKSAMCTVIKHLGPRFLSLQLPGSSLLFLDIINACSVILNSNEVSQTVPRTEAVSILANLLNLTNDLGQLTVLKPEPYIQITTCLDIKDRLVNILLRAGKREPTGVARCIALSALGIFVYKEFSCGVLHPKVMEALNVLLLALKINNKIIAQVASNILFLLCDYAPALWTNNPQMGDLVIRTLCSVLFLHAPLSPTAKEIDKALGMNLLLCLGEWCMRLGRKKLLQVSDYDEKRNVCLLSLVFTVLYKIITGKILLENETILNETHIKKDDFDPNILLDNLNEKSSSPGGFPSKNVHYQDAVVFCAKAIIAHLVIHLGHFPMAIGAARLSSLVVEHDDVPSLVLDELSGDVFSAPNIQLFVLTKNVVASLVELPALEMPGGGATAGLLTADKQVRVILRDLSGKSSWDASILYQSPETRQVPVEIKEIELQSSGDNKWGSVSFFQPESLAVTSNYQYHLPQRAVRHRSPNILPDVSNAAPDLDQLDDLLQYLGYTSPECLENPEQKLNEPSLLLVTTDIEQEAIGSVISQRNIEMDHCRINENMETTTVKLSSVIATRTRAEVGQKIPDELDPTSFQRLLFSQLGLAAWERRKQLHLLSKTERLLREIRNLDTQKCRETHKIAVIYIAPGQEDKNSILSNQGGSTEYEQFLASLAWEVELEGHTGFLGGLQKQGSTGLTAPYYATSLLEAIFHVATRMPGDTPEAVLNKTRHLGNDEVHIVWSEHSRDYRRDIIPTEFCDVLIVIYPLGNQLNRVAITCKPEVPYFGVLFDEAIVDIDVLAGLIRATIICASRAKRTTLPYFQQYYEERARSLETVVTKHKNSTTYEDFISQIYNPEVGQSPCRSTCRTTSTSGNNSGSCSSSQSTLAAALIDSHKTGHKNESKFNRDSVKGVWFNNTNVSQNVESASISPRPLKKLSTSLKSVPRRSLKHETPIDSPPESPTQLGQRK